jgi:hypothetical protein
MKTEKTINEAINPACFLGAVTCRYLLFSQRDLNSKQISQSNNKQELKKVRTGWRYQMLLKEISGEIYDTKTC